MNLSESFGPKDKVDAVLIANAAVQEIMPTFKFTYKFNCVDKDGNLKWEETIENLVTTEGKNDIINKYFKGSSYTAAWYCGLKGAGSANVADTLASHGGWAEETPYSGNRKAITFGTTAAGSNTATVIPFSITGSATVAGAMIASVNTGSSGILYSAGDFAASRTVASGDTLNVTLIVSAA